MQHKTKGIVLYLVDYNDTYSIASVYTEEFGVVSYLTSRNRGKKAKISKSLFHPLAVLDMEVEHSNLRDIHRLKEAKIFFPLYSILMDPIKGTISIFLAEFISKVVKEVQPNKLLFDYLLQSIQILELSEQNYANFHLIFMMRLTQFLGFYPDDRAYTNACFFDMQNGVFVLSKPSHPHFLNPDESQIFYSLLRMTYENMHAFRFTRHERQAIIIRMLEYYRLHLIHFPEIKSLEVLHEVFG